MNKADYTTLINTKLPDATQLPSSQHRDTMHTDPNSIIELVYGNDVTDNNIIETYTTSNANFDYDITIYKVGSNVTITGRVSANFALSSNAVVFQMINTDFLGDNVITYNQLGQKVGSTDVMPLYFLNNFLKIGSSILAGEGYRFTINYKAVN